MSEPEWRRRLTDLLELPADVTLDLPRVLIIGQLHLTVENHRGLVEYSEERVIIGVPTGRLVVYGDDLAIGFIDASEVTVLGQIRSVQFAGTGAAVPGPDASGSGTGAAGSGTGTAVPAPEKAVPAPGKAARGAANHESGPAAHKTGTAPPEEAGT